MRYTLKNLPDEVRRKLPVGDPLRLAPLPPPQEQIAQQTAAQTKLDKSAEKEIHRVFEQWLLANDFSYIHSRMDKPSTIRKGHPDFTVTKGGRVFFVEFKAVGGSLDDEQKIVIAELERNGNQVMVTTDAGAAILQTRDFFK